MIPEFLTLLLNLFITGILLMGAITVLLYLFKDLIFFLWHATVIVVCGALWFFLTVFDYLVVKPFKFAWAFVDVLVLK